MARLGHVEALRRQAGVDAGGMTRARSRSARDLASLRERRAGIPLDPRSAIVDHEGKPRRREGHGWALRNAKPRTTRKALFARGLLPALECHRYTAAEIPGFPRRAPRVAALPRVAVAFLEDGAPRSLPVVREFAIV